MIVLEVAFIKFLGSEGEGILMCIKYFTGRLRRVLHFLTLFFGLVNIYSPSELMIRHNIVEGNLVVLIIGDMRDIIGGE